MIGITKGGRLQKSGETATARGIGLQNINRTGIEHSPEIIDVIAVFTGCDLDARRCVISNEP